MTFLIVISGLAAVGMLIYYAVIPVSYTLHMCIRDRDSIVVAPTQTLSDKECQMLRSASLDIICLLYTSITE